MLQLPLDNAQHKMAVTALTAMHGNANDDAKPLSHRLI